MDAISEGLRKLILAGIGAVAATKEKSEVILDELVKKGELTVEQGKVLNDKVARHLCTSSQKLRSDSKNYRRLRSNRSERFIVILSRFLCRHCRICRRINV